MLRELFKLAVKAEHTNPLSFHHPVAFLRFSTAAQSLPPYPHFMVEYLISSLGFSADEALKASKHLSRLKSTANPNSVLRFFRSHAFSDAQLKKLISWHPRWLSFDVPNNLDPKFRALEALGFSGPDLAALVTSNPFVLNLSFHRSLLPRIDFWKNLLGSTNELIRLARRSEYFLSSSIHKCLAPNLAFLRGMGIPDRKTALVVRRYPRFLLQSLPLLRSSAERVERMGIDPSSGMFLWALWIFNNVNEAKLAEKLQLMASLGWSESEFVMAFRKAPVFLSVSEGMVRRKMRFLIGEAGCTPSFVADRPDLLMYSLERRLIPRYRVMEVLKQKGLHNGEYNLRSIMCLSNKKFMENFVLKHKDKIPELGEAYIGARKVGSAP